MNSLKKEFQNTKVLYKILILAFAALFAVQSFIVIWINLTQLQNHLGFDASSYYLKAAEMYRQGTLFCKNWVDQTTLYFDSAVPIAALLMNLFRNIFVSYGMANILVDIGIICCIAAILKQMKVSFLSRLIVFDFILCPYIKSYFDNANDIEYFSSTLISGSWYGVKIFLSLAFIWAFQLLRREEKISHIQKSLLVLICIGYFISGLSSGYYLGVTILAPAVCCGLVTMFYSNQLNKMRSKEMLYTYGNLLLIVAGKFAATHILGFTSKDSTMVLVGLEDFWINLGSILLGYVELLSGLPRSSNQGVLTIEGLSFVFGFVLMAVTLIALCFVIGKLFKAFDQYKDFALPVMIIVLNVVMFTLLYTTYASQFFEIRYLIIPFFAVLICLAVWLDTLDSKLLLKQYGCILVLICLLAKTAMSDRSYIITKIDTAAMTEIKESVSDSKSPVVYAYGDGLAILARNMRVYDLSKVYKVMKVGEDQSVYFEYWGDYTYYDKKEQWDGTSLLMTDEISFNNLPEAIKASCQLKDKINGISIYESNTNVFVE